MSRPFDAPVNRDFVRERNRVIDYNKTYTLHQRTNFNAGRALLVEVVPSGTPVQSTEHEVARSNVVDELVRHFFHLPANGRFKHVYFNATNDDIDPPAAPTPPIDINEILLDEVSPPAAGLEVNTLIGAILKLFHKNDAKFDDPNDIDQKLKHAYELSKGTAPEGAFNDLLCDKNMGIKYFYDKLKTMFVYGGFFLVICDCDAANERATMRVRVSMLVTYEEPYDGAGAGAGGVPDKLDDVVRDIRARVRPNEKRDNKRYVTQRALPAFETYPHTLGRFVLEAICVYKIPDLSGRSMDVFDFAQARDPTKVIEVLTGQTCLQFLDAYACLNGVPEIKLESVMRALDKSHVQKHTFVFAPETNEPFIQVGDWIQYHLSNTEWHSGVVDEIQPENLKMLVRRWDATVGDFFRDMDNVFVYMFDDQKRFFADIRPGQRVNFRTGITRRAIVKSGVVQGITPDHDEWIVRGDDGKTEHVSHYIKKYNGTGKDKLAYLHEYYYYLGYDFEESETLYSILTLRPIVTYPPETWYDPRNVAANVPLYTSVHTGIRPNLNPDHKDLRLATLFARQYTKTPIFPVQTGSKLPVPDAYVHPVENNAPENKIDASTRMGNPLVPMVRKVTGVYKPRGEVIHRISLPGLDGKPQPEWRHMQSAVLQSVATDQSNAVCKEAWQFQFGVLNDPRALIGSVPLGLAAGALSAQANSTSTKVADRVRAAVAIGTAHLQQVLLRQKQQTIQRNIARVVMKKNLKRLVDEKRRASKILKSAFKRFLVRRLLLKRVRTAQAQTLARAASDAIMPEHPPAPVLTPQRSNELVRTSSSPKQSELQRAVSVTLPSRTSSSASTTTTAPTLGMSMSYDQFMSVSSAGRPGGAGIGHAEAETPRQTLMRSVPDHLARMLDQIRKVQRSNNLDAYTDYDDMRERAMSMLEDTQLDAPTKERIIQEFHLRIKKQKQQQVPEVPEQNALVLFTPNKTTPTLVHNGNEILAIGNVAEPEPEEQEQEQEQEEVVPPSRTGSRPVSFDPDLHGMPRERAETVPPAIRGALLEDIRSMCDSLFTRLQNIQGEYADKGEKWFNRAMRAFLKMAKEYFKVLRPILTRLPRGNVSHAIRVFEDVETIATHLGTRIHTIKELKGLINKLMDKITSMDETQIVIQHFVDHIHEEEAWMYEPEARTSGGRRARVIEDDDDDEFIPERKAAKHKQTNNELDEIFRAGSPEPAAHEQQHEQVFEIDDDAPTPVFEDDDDDSVQFVSDSKTSTTHFGKKSQPVRRRTRLAR